MKRLIAASVLLAACAGCNTMSGLGKDLQSAGGVISGTAEGVQRGATPAPPPPTTTDPPQLCAPDAEGRKPPGCPA
jgi:predicted small secreted protein